MLCLGSNPAIEKSEFRGKVLSRTELGQDRYHYQRRMSGFHDGIASRLTLTEDKVTVP